MSHDQLRVLMEHGEEIGCINMSAFTALVQELELDDDELNGLYEQIEEHGHRAHGRLRPPGGRRSRRT